MIEEQSWSYISKQVSEFPNVPACVSDLCRLPLREVIEQYSIELEEKVIEQSYIDFLQEQIELNARGDEWTSLLMQRLQALLPRVGKATAFLSISNSSWSLWIRFEPDNLHVVWVETFGS